MRATNLVIGTTTLAVIAAAFAGLLVFQKVRSISQRSPLRIVFDGSASGLRRGGSVNFDGVQIGEILSLSLDTPRKVVAIVRVDSNAPIRKDTVVGLEFQGLTGVAAVSLTGGQRMQRCWRDMSIIRSHFSQQFELLAGMYSQVHFGLLEGIR